MVSSFEGAPVGVLGLGVVGGTMASALRKSGVDVVGYDPGAGYPDASLLSKCPVVFVCVGTPDAEDDGLDLSGIWNSISETSEHAEAGTTVVVKSTVPPGTNDRLQKSFPGLQLASSPEFLVAEDPYRTFTRPDRIVVGARDARLSQEIASLLLRLADITYVPLVLTTPTAAELIKLSSNAMLAAKVTMANELAEICREYDVDWEEDVQKGVGLDPRIGPSHLTVTTERGFGGACLPKDLHGLIAAARERNREPKMLAAIDAVNRRYRGFA